MEHSGQESISKQSSDTSRAKRMMDKFDALLSQADDFNNFLHNKKKKHEKQAKSWADDQDEVEIPNEGTYLFRQPSLLQKDGGKLKSYQLESLNWMISLMEANLNGILADDMGLGKTIQTISLLAYRAEFQNIKGPHLVVAPLTTLKNWMAEFQDWFPSCNVVLLLATEKQRNATYESHIKHHNYDVVVTSYQGISSCFKWLTKVKWSTMIVDEAHKIKNDEAMVSQDLRQYSADFKLLLTGTPLSNDLHELWSLLNFILPKIFDDDTIFSEIFEYINSLSGEERQLKQIQVAQKVHMILSPYMKRRTKKEMETSLPPKFEKTLYVSLTPLQVTMYRNYIKYRNPIGKSLQTYKNRSIQMRKICCHPYLFPNIQPKDQVLLGTHLISTSGKMQVLDKLLIKLLPQGHKVLIFSQFTTMLDIIEDYCAFRQYNVSRIDGSFKLDERQKEIKKFKTDPDCQLFLLSTRAGGLGINLVAADVVILYDMDWNPQNDNQAMDRAYRIGQTRPVHVYKFICEHTVQERMAEVQKTKLIWDDLVIQKGAIFLKGQPVVNATDIDRMAKLGVGEIFRFDGKVTDQDIDQIISLGQEKDQKKLEEIREKLEERIKQQMGDLDKFNPYATICEEKNNDSEVPDKDYDQEIQNYLNARRQKLAPKVVRKVLPEFQLYPQRLELQEYINRVDLSTEQYRVQLEEKIKNLTQKGFPTWTESDFNKFIDANQANLTKDYKAISKAIGTKTAEQVEKYSKEFFRAAPKLPQMKKYLKKIDVSQIRIQKHNKQLSTLAWKRKHVDESRYVLPKLENRRKYIDALIAKYVIKNGMQDIDGLYDHLQSDVVMAFSIEPLDKKGLPKKIERVIEFMEKQKNDEGTKKQPKDITFENAIKFFLKPATMEEDNLTVTAQSLNKEQDVKPIEKIKPKDKNPTQPKPSKKAKSKSQTKNRKSLQQICKITENVSQENE